MHGEYSRAIYPAYFADHDFAALFRPPVEASATGSAVASRLRREGYDWRPNASAIAARTLIVHGADDVIPPRLAGETAALIPRSRTLIIEGAGHMPFFEQPDEFFAAVRGFLDEPDAGS